MRSYAFLSVAGLSLTACAAAQMHTEDQLNTVAQACGLSDGEVMQDASEKKLLFLMRSEPPAPQRACVYRWARHNHLRLVVIDIANGPAS